MKTYSLQELNEFLRRVVALNFNEAVWITAEIGQIGISRGHYYIDLLQKEGDEVIAQMSSVIWAMDYNRIQRTLGINTEVVIAEGVEIKLKGRLDFHERYGLKILIEDIDASYTIGQLEMQRRQLIADLQRKGLMVRNKAISLPSVIQRIAVISSETAAGWQDFKQHLLYNEMGLGFNVQFFQSAMQGSLVEKMMLHQLEIIRTQAHQFDCVVIIRGGGSRLDLAAFDTPSVCEAVAKFPLPVLTGIGHDIDQTVLDLVAHSALKTPTAVADFILTQNLKFDSALSEIRNYIHFYIKERLNTEGVRLERCENIISTHSNFTVKNQKNQIQNLHFQLSKSVESLLKFEKIKIETAQKMIDLVSVESTLKRGFSISKVKNKIITHLSEVKEGDILETELSDGIIKSKIL